MPPLKDAKAFAVAWKDACNSHDLDRVVALYSDDVIFKSPRVATVSGENSGILQGKAAVREYWRQIFQRRPDLTFSIGDVFAGVDSIAVEYRVSDHIHGIEFMTLNGNGLISLAVGNDVIAP